MKQVKYTIYMECLGGDEQLQILPDGSITYDCQEHDAEPKWFDTLKQARGYCEMIDEYIMDSDGNYIEAGEYVIHPNGGLVREDDLQEDPADRDDKHYHEEQDHIAMEKAKETK